ncbi:MAG TPA: SDR family oxidoreductase [Anaerolineales bacterium]|nr:SDR family oxidoreductase [Anaerolineales bacterium]
MTYPKSLLITGASTGIGRACALYMAALGWRVFAGVRRESDAAALLEGAPGHLIAGHPIPDRPIPDRLIPLFLDVTQLTSIAAAAEQIAAAVGQAGLDGLVNNAGIAIAGPLEFIALPDLRRQLEVNVIGQVAVTQAALPLLRQARGRIVYISSVGGLLAAPYFAPYSASKFALEAFSDSLRVELRPWGIQVVVVEPGSIATPIWEKSLAAAEERLAAMPPAAEQLYGPSFPILRRLVRSSAQRGLPAEQVARVVAEALTARYPRVRYVIPRRRGYMIALMRLLPVRLRDRILALRFGLN